MSGGTGRKSIREELEDHGFRQPRRVRYQWLTFFAVVALATAPFCAGTIVLYSVDRDPGVFGLAGLGVALAAAILTYQQWRAARREISLDKFYDRLGLVNERFMSWPAARSMLFGPAAGYQRDEQPEDLARWQRDMYVYLELDNLEYAVEKFWIGFMSPETALRAARTFRFRCETKAFRDRANELVRGRLIAGYSDYTERTCEALKKICDVVERARLTRGAVQDGRGDERLVEAHLARHDLAIEELARRVEELVLLVEPRRPDSTLPAEPTANGRGGGPQEDAASTGPG